ncbi:hypothetical protein [Corynebacterium sp. A21]|uniref:hypothetical protein n=1 Tax=Corynebacterium sp. A21 TaxID=3457318 RepID=UPI003FD448BB
MIITGLLVLIGVYGFAFISRGSDVGDDHACHSAYSGGPDDESPQNEYHRIVDSAVSPESVFWSAEWSYFPPGWVCTASEYNNYEMNELGITRPDRTAALTVISGYVLVLGGAITVIGSLRRGSIQG